MSKLETIPENVPKDSSFDSFFTAAMRANFSEQENLDYEKAMMNELDYENAMITAREEGISNERIRMAKAMKSKCYTAQDFTIDVNMRIQKEFGL